MSVNNIDYPLSAVYSVLESLNYQPVNKDQHSIMIPIPKTGLMLSVEYFPFLGKSFQTSIYRNGFAQYLSLEGPRYFAKTGLNKDVSRIEEEIKRLEHLFAKSPWVESPSTKKPSTETQHENDVKSLREELELQKVYIKTIEKQLAEKDEKIKKMVRLTNNLRHGGVSPQGGVSPPP